MHYREIEDHDIPAIFAVRIQTWHTPRGAEELVQMGITPESVRAMLQAGTHRGWLAEIDGTVVGFTMGNRQNGEMWVVAVLPEWENQGIGRQLMERVESWLFSEGWSEIWLTTDPDETVRAIGFYRRLGWTDWKFERGDRYMRKSAPPRNT